VSETSALTCEDFDADPSARRRVFVTAPGEDWLEQRCTLRLFQFRALGNRSPLANAPLPSSLALPLRRGWMAGVAGDMRRLSLNMMLPLRVRSPRSDGSWGGFGSAGDLDGWHGAGLRSRW
jgi:hypothetical protein